MRSIFIQIFIVLGLLFYLNPDLIAQHENLSPDLQSIINETKSISSLRSVLIQQNGVLLGKQYFQNASADYPYNIKSASKSIITILIGIAVDKGQLSVNDLLGGYFPDYFEKHPNPKKENISNRNLLSMQAGLETTSFHNYGRWVISDNWVEFQLDQPLEEKPGGNMVYSTGISHLLSVILTKATGSSTKAFADENLFKPLDIRVGGWDRDPQGFYMGGNNLALTPEALLKIGQMMLNGGKWEGKQIVSEQWVEDSFKSYTRSNFNPYNYGYMWWNRKVGSYKVHFAWGFGGQYIFINQELDAVVIITSFLKQATQRRQYKEPVFDLLENHILPFLDNRLK